VVVHAAFDTFLNIFPESIRRHGNYGDRFCLIRIEQPDSSEKISSDTTGDRSGDLPTSSVAP
jgi:hypothetical protein